jgi:hypothetical protein
MIHVQEIDTDDPKQVRRFLDFPFELYRDCPQWVPPMMGDARLQLDRKRYPFYRHSDAAFFLATGNGATLGRIAVLEHRRYTGETEGGPPGSSQDNAFFYLFDTVDELEAARALFNVAATWARQRGLAHLVGPFGFAAGDPIGLLVEGFDHRAAMGVNYNYDYYARLVEACGFRKEFDLVSCHLTHQARLPEKIHDLAERVKQRRGFRVTDFRNKQELRALVPKIKQVYNETLARMERNAPLTEEEMDAVAERLISVADPTLIKIVMSHDEVVGFLFAFPDLSAAIQRCKGRLWPLGWLWLLREYKRTRWVNLVLYSEMAKTLQTGRFTDADLVQVRDNNPKMIADLARLGAPVYKRHRVYRKPT